MFDPPARLRDAYAEPWRRYHTLAHVEACLAELGAVPDLTEDERRLLEQAIWWHDAVYDPTRSDNEERSAELALGDLLEDGVSAAEAAEVARLVRLTKGHAAEPGDRLGALLVSIDLSILGQPPEAYQAYADAVRAEYGFVPDEAYRAGRAAVLRRFLDAPEIFADPAFRTRYERQARENIAAEIRRLEA